MPCFMYEQPVMLHCNILASSWSIESQCFLGRVKVWMVLSRLNSYVLHHIAPRQWKPSLPTSLSYHVPLRRLASFGVRIGTCGCRDAASGSHGRASGQERRRSSDPVQLSCGVRQRRHQADASQT
jgi:hypothetical protein